MIKEKQKHIIIRRRHLSLCHPNGLGYGTQALIRILTKLYYQST